MSLSATFYTFSKKVKSTAIPSSGGTNINILLKDSTSILSPTIRISRDTSPVLFNYCHIPAFHRWYFIEDWSSDHGFWIATLRNDPLASWRSGILSSFQYVDRSASRSDSFIIDGTYAVTTDVEMTNVDVTASGGTHRPFLTGEGSNVHYVISASCGGDSSVSFVRPETICGAAYYCMTPGQAENFMKYLLDDPTYLTLDITEITDSLAKTIFNPVEYIGETYILPYNPGESLNSSNMVVGWWPIDVENAYLSFKRTASYHKWKIWESNQILIPSHPQTSLVGEFVNSTPYTVIELNASIFGTILIDPVLASSYQAMVLEVYGDFKGKVELDIYFYDGATSSKILWRRYFAEAAVPISVSQMSSDVGKLVSGASQTVSGLASATSSWGAPMEVASGVVSMLGSQVPQLTGKSQGASVAYLMDDWYVHVEHHLITKTAPNIKGAPLCEVNQLSDLTGYCQILTPVIDLPATSAEIEEIENGMRSGFFLE